MKYVNITTKNTLLVPKEEPTEKKRLGLGVILVIVLVVVGLVAGLLLIRGNFKNILNPISIVANMSSVNLKENDGRTNVLILGSDKRSKSDEGSNLTDTVLIASIGKVDKDVVLISIPRDLWVKWLDSEGKDHYSKVNAIYPIQNAIDPDGNEGSTQLMAALEDILGIRLHYYTIINFDLFREIIDTLGGIQVTVDATFTDHFYPIEGMENAPVESDRYETVTFTTGSQVMNGDTALKYVRSRHGDNGEGTDFARSKRQQKVIEAIKNKALSTQTLLNPSKIKELYDIYSRNIDTNLDLQTLQSFFVLSQQIDFSKVVSIVLDDRSEATTGGGLLYAPEDTTLYGNQYVLIPKTGDYSQIHAYVQKYLFGDK